MIWALTRTVCEVVEVREEYWSENKQIQERKTKKKNFSRNMSQRVSNERAEVEAASRGTFDYHDLKK